MTSGGAPRIAALLFRPILGGDRVRETTTGSDLRRNHARRGELRGGEQDGGTRGDSALHRRAEDRQDASPAGRTSCRSRRRRRFKGGRSPGSSRRTSGDITIKLMPDVAPMHVTSTIYLTRLGFYDDVAVPPRDPRLHGAGRRPDRHAARAAPATSTRASSIRSVKHDKGGLLSMANAGPEHRRQPVLPHVRRDALARRQAHDLRRGRRRAWTR